MCRHALGAWPVKLPPAAPRPAHCDELMHVFVHQRSMHDSPVLHCTVVSQQGSPVPS